MCSSDLGGALHRPAGAVVLAADAIAGTGPAAALFADPGALDRPSPGRLSPDRLSPDSPQLDSPPLHSPPLDSSAEQGRRI